ncbi:uncharacterized protein [Blastocystis hominis]|uniref:Aminotransferase class V domain-containing protein n=1 Tax=Blastocystis hominis TaxID=12968 RepID=D8LWN0_BLAHO|nr:uncharacterized protein [Blastocystis hominis]CBK20219.2 unnamed protein product [Blastocystis hominis]|eukprot:XP_012894267.1 uncharacterized protein [Blastocystis hominis]
MRSRARFCFCREERSESINQALIGGVRALNDSRRTIIASCFEHPAVNETLAFLEKEYGFKIEYLRVNKYGFVDVDQLDLLLTPDVAMVTCMLANNEIGSIQPIASLVERVRSFESSAQGNGPILFHCDASQAGGKMKIDTKKLGVDYMTMAGHKIYATKGVGILYIRKNSITPAKIIHGANQEGNRRAGTENVILCVGMGKAAELIVETEKTREG